jgi:hypothetical protein
MTREYLREISPKVAIFLEYIDNNVTKQVFGIDTKFRSESYNIDIASTLTSLKH